MSLSASESPFVDSLALQRIFEEYYTPVTTSTPALSTKGSKITTRGDTDLFLAQYNVVRCCNTLDRAGTFRILNVDVAFDIEALEINSSGSLLAVVGQSHITVVVLPSLGTIANNGSAVIECRSFAIDIGSDVSVTKVLWHSVAPQDCVLVVLTSENTILTFDVFLSTSTYQNKVELDKYGITAKSIAFGASDQNLAGLLTLYISTETEVHAIYPFLHSSARIVVSKSLVENYVADSEFLTMIIDLQFPTSVALVAIESSTLKRSALRQLAFAKRIQKKLQDDSIDLKEFRPGLDDLSVVTTDLPEGEYSIQGPLVCFASDEKIADLRHLQATLQFSSLAVVTVGRNGSVALSTLSQLGPLVMKWKEDEEFEKEFLKGSIPVAPKAPKVTSAYHKPKRGFGFLEDSTSGASESESSIYTEELRRYNAKMQEYNSIKQQMSFWKNKLTTLTRITNNLVFQNLGLPCIPTLISSPKKQNLLAIATGKKSCLVNLTSVLDSLSAAFLLGNMPKSSTSNPRFQLVENATSTKYVAIVTDPFNSQYLISLNCQKLSIERCKISKALVISTPTKSEKTILKDEKERINAITIAAALEKDPIDELVGEISQLKVGLSTDNTKKKRLDPADLESVKLFNRLSNDVIRQVSQLTEYLLRLDKRLNTQSQILKKEVEVSNYFMERDVGWENQGANEIRLAELKERQVKAKELISRVDKKVANAVLAVQRNRALVVSDAEDQWFKELKRIRALFVINKDNLQGKVDLLESQVKKITNRAKGQVTKSEEVLGYTQIAQNFQNTQELHRVRSDLSRIGETILNLKTRVSNLQTST